MLMSASYALRTAPRLEPSGMYTPQKAEGGTALGMAMSRISRCGVGDATGDIIAEMAERVMSMMPCVGVSTRWIAYPPGRPVTGGVTGEEGINDDDDIGGSVRCMGGGRDIVE